MAGSNLDFGSSKRILARVMNTLGSKRQGRVGSTTKGNMTVKSAGAPVTNAANDDPGEAGVFCYDSTNDDSYICTAYTNSTTHTWTKIST